MVYLLQLMGILLAKSLFGFFYYRLWKAQTKFLANPINSSFTFKTVSQYSAHQPL